MSSTQENQYYNSLSIVSMLLIVPSPIRAYLWRVSLLICKMDTGRCSPIALRELNSPSVISPVKIIKHISYSKDYPFLQTAFISLPFISSFILSVRSQSLLSLMLAYGKTLDRYSIWFLHSFAFADHEHHYVCGRCSFLMIQIFEKLSQFWSEICQ